MTFSEFGRRIKSNGSLGTDHGAGAPVIFFGAALNTGSSAITAQTVSGMIGSSPNIPLNASVQTRLQCNLTLDKFILRLCKIGCV
jgi:uncharacterized protein (DUF1501 family)